MRAPKKIADKVREYQEAKKKADKAYEAVISWLIKKTGASDVNIGEIFISDEPIGELQCGGEYCDQHHGYFEDDFSGTYYHPVEGENNYLGYSYWT